MRIFFTVNLAAQFSLILNQQQVNARLLSFVHFQEGGNAKLDYYAEHGHFKLSDRSKYKAGLITETKEQIHDNRKPRRTVIADESGTASSSYSILHPSVDAHPTRRRIRHDV